MGQLRFVHGQNGTTEARDKPRDRRIARFVLLQVEKLYEKRPVFQRQV